MDMNNIPKDKFRLVNDNRRLSDQKFEDKPIGYFKDAWIPTIIILAIILFSLLAPVVINSHDATFMDVYYAKKPSRSLLLSKIGIASGTVTRNFAEAGLVRDVAIGVGAEDRDGTGEVTVAEGLKSYYQPVRVVGESGTDELLK